MKKKIMLLAAAAVMLFSAIFPQSQAFCAEKPTVSALAAVLISADTGEVVFALNEDKKLPMASTTKIMTTLLCLESGDLYEEFVVDSDAIKVEGSSMGLREGDIVTKYALCCGMLLPSGNDAANAAAVRIAGSIEAFAELMNQRAGELGLTRTFFVTPSGLEGDGHGSSALDMAMLAREALRNETFREICSSASIKLSFGNPPYERWLKNTNKLLTMCEGVYGVKTGFTDEAGRCLVSACERNGVNLICVTLNDKNDWNDHAALYDYGFKTVKNKQLPIPDSLYADLAGGETDTVGLTVGNEPVTVSTASRDMSEFTYTVISSPFIYAPVADGEQCGELCISHRGKEIKRVPLFADGDFCVKKSPEAPPKKGLLNKIINKLGKLFS